MANKIKVLVWIHRSKLNKSGLAPLILRLSYQNKKVERATGFYLKPEDRNVSRQKVKGTNDISRKINDWIQNTVSKISSICREYDKDPNIYLPGLMNSFFSQENNKNQAYKKSFKLGQGDITVLASGMAVLHQSYLTQRMVFLQ